MDEPTPQPACPVEATLTPTGYSLKPILDAMCAWGRNYKALQQER